MVAKKTTASKTTTKKATTKKVTEKKPVAKKTAAPKKAVAKKTVKKEAAPKVVKKTVKDYEDIINWKKGEKNAMGWLYEEMNAGDLLTEVEAGVDNIKTVCEAMLNCMLEGDSFVVEPKTKTKVSKTLTVRYYTDNLSPERKKYFE